MEITKNMHGAHAQKGQSLIRQSQNGMRRSCDACGRKKKRCDGERPCRRCVRSKGQCRYSKRRWHNPDLPQHQCQRRLSNQSDLGAVRARADLVHSTPGGLQEHHELPLKRCTLSASPATGLVGMQENAFLNDYFGCVGFMPLTNESQIREAMVKIMMPAYPRREVAFGTDSFSEEGHSGTLLGGAMVDESSFNRWSKDPSVCTFWCAVAMGALARGSPFEAVESYAQLAREALAASGSSSTHAELAKASAILTYLHSFLGDSVKFREYLDVSETFVQASVEEGSIYTHAGLREVVLYCRTVANVQDGPMDLSWVHEEDPPQVGEVTAGVGLFLFVAQSFRTFDKAVFAKAQERCGRELERFYSLGPSHRSYHPDDPLPRDVSEAIAAVLEAPDSLEFERLQETADRAGIRDGVGSLFINGTLIFENAVKGDLEAALERLGRSVAVYERYPGLCRCIMASHLSHIFLTTLAAIGDDRARRMYDRLRRAFNSCRASHTLPVPPLDEWEGMALICSDLTCRSFETLVKSEHMRAFTALPVNSIRNSAVLPQSASSPQREAQSDILRSADVVDREIVDSVQAASGSKWTGSKTTRTYAGTQNLAGACCSAGAALEPLASRSYLGGQSDIGTANALITHGAATKAFGPSSRSAWIGGHHEDYAEPEGDEITAADWLEVTHTMSDAVRAS